ncbi:hypothetical protein BGW38_001317, partial [Lunasporangiospora selenospora]
RIRFRVPQDFVRQGDLVHRLDLYLGNIPRLHQNHIRRCCPNLRQVRLHFQHLNEDTFMSLFEPRYGLHTERTCCKSRSYPAIPAHILKPMDTVIAAGLLSPLPPPSPMTINGFVSNSIQTLEVFGAVFTVVPKVFPWLSYVGRHGQLLGLERLVLGGDGPTGVSGTTKGSRDDAILQRMIKVEDVIQSLRTFPKLRELDCGTLPIGDLQEFESRRTVDPMQQEETLALPNSLFKYKRDTADNDKKTLFGNDEDVKMDAPSQPAPLEPQPQPPPSLQLRRLEIYPWSSKVLETFLEQTPHLEHLTIRKLAEPEHQILSVIHHTCPGRLISFKYFGDSTGQTRSNRRTTGQRPVNHNPTQNTAQSQLVYGGEGSNSRGDCKSNIGWHEFFLGYKHLEYITLEQAKITDPVVEAIAATCFQALRRLSLSFQTNVSSKSLRAIVQACTQLEELHCITDSISGDLFESSSSSNGVYCRDHGNSIVYRPAMDCSGIDNSNDDDDKDEEGEAFVPWECAGSLRALRLTGVKLRWNSQEQQQDDNVSFRKQIQAMPQLETLSIKGSGFNISSLLDRREIRAAAASNTVAKAHKATASRLWKRSFSQQDYSQTIADNQRQAEILDRMLCLPDQGVFEHRYLEDISMPQFGPGDETISLQQLQLLLRKMPNVEYINFSDSYEDDARDWLRRHRPYLDMGIVVWS